MGRQRPNHPSKGATPPRRAGRREKSESLVVASMRRRPQPPRSEGGGTWVDADANSAGPGQGSTGEETLFGRITAPLWVRKLLRTLYRKATMKRCDERPSESRMR